MPDSLQTIATVCPDCDGEGSIINLSFSAPRAYHCGTCDATGVKLTPYGREIIKVVELFAKFKVVRDARTDD